MEREKVIELHEKAKREARLGEFIEYFARLVERETLERAAKKFRVKAGLCAHWMTHTRNFYLDGADELDSMKDNHDEE